MVEASKETGRSASATPTSFDYLGDAGKSLPLHPVVASQIAAFTAATAIGFGLATQMTGLMLAGMRDATRQSNPVGGEKAEPSLRAQSEDTVVQQVREQQKNEKQSEVVTAQQAKPAQRRSATPKKGVETASVVAASKISKPRSRAKSNDLKRISGLGPKVEELLRKSGVNTFADIAAWTEADVARFDRELGLEGRILRDDWIGQAQMLKGK